jgi:hypothetical protein
MGKENECLGCGNKFKRNEAAIKCNVCGLWSHKTCSGISNDYFKCLAEQQKAGAAAYWACRPCATYAAGMNHRLKEIHEKADEAVRIAKESKEETVKLRMDMERDKVKVEKRLEQSEFSIMEEMNLREEKRKNVVIHGLAEANEIEGWKRVEADKRGLNEIFTVLDVNIIAESDVEFCRRIGERGDRARPLVVGFFTDWAKSTLMKNSRYRADTHLSNISIVPDLTERQRRMEREMVEEAERKNREELSADDQAKNLCWKVVGKKGQRRLIKAPDNGERSRGGRGGQ